ncbi:exosome component Rrp46 [Armillaria nabsnona]|nr:exosome component Rrp46 [Armillaria nabsnona]
MSRRDGRKNNDLRDLSVNFDDLARVDGSARFGFGPENLALASLSGPIEVRLSAENPSKATLDVHLRPLSNVSATESKSLASAIASALTPSLLLTQNPRTLVQLVVQALSLPSKAWKDGLTAAMINASTLAFFNAASIPMKGMVCAVTVGRLASSKQFIVDPSGEEAVFLDAGGCFAFLFADGLDERVKCVWTNWRSFSGGFEEKDLVQAKNVASESAREIWSKMKLCVNYREQPDSKAHAEKNDGPGEDSDDDKMII